MLEKINKEVKFNGKEYLDYLKYKDNKPKIKLSEKNQGRLVSLGLVCIIAIMIIYICSIVYAFTYQPTTSTFKYTWKGILMFLGICAGLGWVLHGTGFLLVRR